MLEKLPFFGGGSGDFEVVAANRNNVLVKLSGSGDRQYVWVADSAFSTMTTDEFRSYIGDDG